MSFANPAYLALLILVPVYLIFWWRSKKSGPAVQISFFAGLSQVKVWSGWKYLPYVQVLLLAATWSLLVVALARPQQERQEESVKKNGIDIVLALDVSGSMLAEDLKPNRMEAAKESITTFINDREDDRLGIVVFAGKAFTQSPLTFDYEILKEYLSSITTDTVDQRVQGLSGTAVGDAVLAGVTRLTADEDVDRSKVLILATDGDANVGVDPKLAAQKAADEGVKIYTIGIGSEEGALIPTVNALGQKVWMTDEQGQPMRAVFNEEALKEIAETSGGQYFRAADKQGFDAVLAEINSLEKTDVAVAKTTRYEDAHEQWLGLAGLALVLWVLSLGMRPIIK